MTSQPPVLLIFDLSAVMTGKTREWQELSQYGDCFLPSVVLEEIQSLAKSAPEPALEQTAREFLRFYPTSGWQLTTVSASHPSLQSASGADLSKKARQSLAVAEGSYGLALEHPGELVVLIANSQTLLQSIYRVGTPNLCGLSLAALRQWGRSGEQPPAIAQQLQLMQSVPKPLGATPSQSKPTISAQPKLAMTGPASAVVAPKSMRPSAASQILSSVMVVVGLAIAGLIAWSIIQPKAFKQFWQQTGLPALPGDSTPPKPKLPPK
ncbi:MAG: PIN domain-containing protein [Leptolyngbyaceae bacterium]|nr:PIN domain-containing protein [Leptolyngbyaceae bacterium]